MNNTELLTPREVLEQVARALPDGLREQTIVVGSLAAGYHFFAGDGAKAIRTKNVDCLFSPHAKAVTAAVTATERLLDAGWSLREDASWGQPGKPDQALDQLPMVRLRPPEHRANLLHHPVVGDALIAGTDHKRSNKDLGRVLALAHLCIVRDRREGSDELAQWPERMWLALQARFGAQAQSLALRAGKGLHALLEREADLDQALRIANLGLLTSLDVALDAFRASARRLQAEVLEPLNELARTA